MASGFSAEAGELADGARVTRPAIRRPVTTEPPTA